MSGNSQQDQQHPQERQDREVINRLFTEGATSHNLAELARLSIRYRNFPGAREIQRDLNLLMNQWELTEEQLYETTRQLHAANKVYQPRKGDEPQDWS
jgi:hypothetical protein